MSNFNRPTDPADLPSAWDDPRVTAYVLGELSDSQRSEFEAAISGDPALRQAVQEAREVTDQLKSLLSDEKSPGLDKERRDKILAASAAGPTATVASAADRSGTERSGHVQLSSKSSTRRLVPWLLAAAASLLLLLGLLPTVLTDRTAMDTPDQARSKAEQAKDKSYFTQPPADESEPAIPPPVAEKLSEQMLEEDAIQNAQVELQRLDALAGEGGDRSIRFESTEGESLRKELLAGKATDEMLRQQASVVQEQGATLEQEERGDGQPTPAAAQPTRSFGRPSIQTQVPAPASKPFTGPRNFAEPMNEAESLSFSVDESIATPMRRGAATKRSVRSAPESNLATGSQPAPNANAPSVNAPSVNAPSVNAPSAEALSAEALSAEALSAEASAKAPAPLPPQPQSGLGGAMPPANQPGEIRDLERSMGQPQAAELAEIVKGSAEESMEMDLAGSEQMDMMMMEDDMDVMGMGGMKLKVPPQSEPDLYSRNSLEDFERPVVPEQAEAKGALPGLSGANQVSGAKQDGAAPVVADPQPSLALEGELAAGGEPLAALGDATRHSEFFGVDPNAVSRESLLRGRTGPAQTQLGVNRQRFAPIVENDFKRVKDEPISTFSVDVDTASYSKVRRTLLGGRLPDPDAVRIEELINYFHYAYQAPAADAKDPFAVDVKLADCPWNRQHQLARIAIQGKTMDTESRPPCNLVFLLDTSGSMNAENKFPLVIEGMRMLTKRLTEKDRVAIVAYAGRAGTVLESTPANKRRKIRRALDSLSAGGSTNGAEGIQLAYAAARDNFITDGVNRVILCTDGDFNVGISDTESLVRVIEEQASDGIYLTALGFGMDNHNDEMMEKISGKGNGNYAFIDTAAEARKVLVRETDATLVTIAKDVKLKIQFNARLFSQYRLIGYENRVMPKEDFDNDKKDAGEIGAGHQVTALYELIPVQRMKESTEESPQTERPKYLTERALTEAASQDETVTVDMRYKLPDQNESTPVQFVIRDQPQSFEEAGDDFRFAAAVASFGMQLRGSRFAGNWTLNDVETTARQASGQDEDQVRDEFVQLVRQAKRLRGE
ncbi:DUF3520 domain-containing protein [Roseiconus nitratireducens]|uniref:DUF3520 domain-containing protein n=1 Tax=Roseiconus nitratireducens TaxID=2605748 RepID=A0A5M6DHF7_9BACT|nr:von Willebrand factor type A domain-containing protein [Roseiconus nitratireducens]KAA5546978.1 DUF3520 domain-containing protein [Roseiconus nitratireducens]